MGIYFVYVNRPSVAVSDSDGTAGAFSDHEGLGWLGMLNELEVDVHSNNELKRTTVQESSRIL